MALVHHWPCNEGTGTDINEIITPAGTYDLAPISGDGVRWGKDRIIGLSNRDCLCLDVEAWALGPRAANHILRSANGISAVSTPSLSFVFRHVMAVDGPMINFESGSYITTWQETIRLASSPTLLTNADYDYAAWTHLVLVSDGANTKVYANGSWVRDVVATLDLDGFVRLFSYDDSSAFLGGAELTDIRVYDNQLSAGDITALYATYGSPPSSWSVYSPGHSICGFTEFTENDTGSGADIWSRMSVVNNTNEVEFGGHTCIGGGITMIPHRLRNAKLYTYYETFVPSNFDANHLFDDLYTLFVTSRLHGGTVITPHLWPYYIHELPSQDITSYKIGLFSSGGDSVVDMAGFPTNREFPKNEWVTLEMIIDPPNDTVQVWVNGYLEVNITNFIFTYDTTALLLGLWQGTHPQNAGNKVYLRELYVGEEQYTAPGGGMSARRRRLRRNGRA